MTISRANTPRSSHETLSIAGWCLSAAAFACVMLMAEPAWAGPLGRVGTIINEFLNELKPIIRAVFTICGFVLAYTWVKGSQEARTKTERYFIGLVIAFSITEIISFFMPDAASAGSR